MTGVSCQVLSWSAIVRYVGLLSQQDEEQEDYATTRGKVLTSPKEVGYHRFRQLMSDLKMDVVAATVLFMTGGIKDEI